MKHRFLSLFLVAFLLIPFMGPISKAADTGTIKIGVLFSITGKARSLGEPEKNAVLMVEEEINKAGGINGQPVQVIIADDETSEATAVYLVRKLIKEDQVLAIIGPSISGISMRVKPICEEAKVPMVSCGAAEGIVTPVESSRYVFKTPQLDSHVAIRILEQMKKMGITKVAILSEATPFGESGRKQVLRYAQELGVQVVAEETFKPNDITMVPQLKKAEAAGAQAVVSWAMVPVQTLVPKNMRQLGMKIPLFCSHAFGNPKYIEMAGEAAEGIIFPAGRLLVVDLLPDTHPQKKVLTSFKKDYEKRYDSAVSTFGGHAYDALWLVVNAIKAKGVTPNMDLSQARTLIRDGLEQTKEWTGTAGIFTMSPTEHTGLDKDKSLEMLTVKGGKMVPLEAREK